MNRKTTGFQFIVHRSYFIVHSSLLPVCQNRGASVSLEPLSTLEEAGGRLRRLSKAPEQGSFTRHLRRGPATSRTRAGATLVTQKKCDGVASCVRPLISSAHHSGGRHMRKSLLTALL